MKQYARQSCACGEIGKVTQTASPHEFKLVCPQGHVRLLSWTSSQKPPQFVTVGAAKIDITKRKPGGRKAGDRKPLPDLIGKRSGDLEVLEFAGMKDNRRQWLCRCVSTIRTGSECGNTRVVETKILNHVGGRRCRACNQHLLQQRATDASRWMYGNRKPATVKG